MQQIMIIAGHNWSRRGFLYQACTYGWSVVCRGSIFNDELLGDVDKCLSFGNVARC